MCVLVDPLLPGSCDVVVGPWFNGVDDLLLV